jgi:hypothetical protein
MLEERGLGQTILVVPREADIPAGLMRLDRLSIHDGVIKPLLPPHMEHMTERESPQ